MDVSELVERSRTGEVAAFTELVRRYQGMAFGYAYATLGDFGLAEDAVQQAFVIAYGGLGRLEDPERFGGWLRGIVRFECGHLRRRRGLAQVPIETAAGVAAAGPGPEEVAEAREGLDRVLGAIAALPPLEREATVLFYLQEQSQREVAAFLNVPVTTVNNRLRSARNRLRAGGLLEMAGDALKRHGLPEDFAKRVGEVVRTQGPVIEARFDAENRPPILNAVTIGDGAADAGLTAEVAQYLDDELVRAIVLGSDGEPQALRSGLRVVDTGTAVRAPLDGGAVRRVIAAVGRPAGTGVLETGIKVIDLLCPLPVGGTIGLVGDMGTGKVVVVEELIQRLAGGATPLAALVFVGAEGEVPHIQKVVEYRTSATVEAIYLPVADTSPEALGAATAELDAVLAFSGPQAKQGLWPAIDPLRSRSRRLDAAVVGREQFEVAREVRALLELADRLPEDERSASDEAMVRRADRVRRYLSQPFFIAEPFTQRRGQFVPRETAMREMRALLADGFAAVTDEALYMAGSLAAIAGA